MILQTENIQSFIDFIDLKEDVYVMYDGQTFDDCLIDWFKTGCKSYLTCLDSKGRVFAEKNEKDYPVRYVSEPFGTFAVSKEAVEILKKCPYEIKDYQMLGKYLINNGINCIQILNSQ